MFEFGREVCGNFDVASQREWLVTNGIGGYACGTLAGVLTRHYHGLLVAALKPPLERTVTLVKLDESVIYHDRVFHLFTNQWEDGGVEPLGYLNIQSFHIEGTIPVWTFVIADALIQKRIWMEHGKNTTYVQYKVLRASAPIQMSLKAIVNYRNHHEGIDSERVRLDIQLIDFGAKVGVGDLDNAFYIKSDKAEFTAKHVWYKGYYQAMENYRGTETQSDNLYAGDFHIVVDEGDVFTIIASTDEDQMFTDSTSAYTRRLKYAQDLILQSELANAPFQIQQLVLASDQFVVRRGAGHSIIAGYPWFGDWGRDTMIALPGLTLSTKRYDIASSILQIFAEFVDQGMLPNRFPDIGDEPEYNTVDATLWYFEAIRAYFEHTSDLQLIETIFPVLQDIVRWHIKGTRYGIHVDPEDGLLFSGEQGVQLTWMDVKVDDWVVTPRTGKAVEINALWYNALCTMASFARELGVSTSEYQELAERVRTSFERFWNGKYLSDVLDTPDQSVDNTIRPNQLIAVAIHHTPVNKVYWRTIVDVCAQKLLTSHGLRSLDPDNPEYIGLYGGDRLSRDRAYHQGTVWSWLIGPFVQAYLRAYEDNDERVNTSKAFIEPLLMSLNSGVIGNISEIFDGDAPHLPRGAFAQAWGVAELLRSWLLIESEYR